MLTLSHLDRPKPPPSPLLFYSNARQFYLLIKAQFRGWTSHEPNLIPIWADRNKIILPVDSDAELNLPNLIHLRQIKHSGHKIYYNNLCIRLSSRKDQHFIKVAPKVFQRRSSRLTQVGKMAEPIEIQSAELNWFRRQTFHEPNLM